MTKVFIGGSRHISRLNPQVRERLDKMIEKELAILIGDANGADKAMQTYLASRGYQYVEVFCSGKVCRNNLGNWRVRQVAVDKNARGADFYSAKDQVMAADSDIGFMLWDGSSIGTIANVFRLTRNGKRAVLYDRVQGRFHEFRDTQGWDDFIDSRDPALRRKLAERVRAPEREAVEPRLFG
jgi:hypothetical protein